MKTKAVGANHTHPCLRHHTDAGAEFSADAEYDVRMARRLFALGSVISLLLWVAAITLWARSYRGGEGWAFSPRAVAHPSAITGDFANPPYEWRQCRWIFSSRGRVQFFQNEFGADSRHDLPEPLGYQRKASLVPTGAGSGPPVPGWQDWSIPGISYTAEPTAPRPFKNGTWTTMGYHVGRSSLIVDWWLMTAIASVLPLLYARRFWRLRRMRKRRGVNLCRVCGYDLRASSERCPECGASIL